MIRFRDLTIRRKLGLLLMGTSGAAVLVASLAFYGIVLGQYDASYRDDLESLAKVIGFNSQASLMFDVPEDAEKILASLRNRPAVVSAGIYQADGRLLAAYETRVALMEHGRPPAALEDWKPSEKFVLVTHIVEERGALLGTVCLLDDMRSIRNFRNIATGMLVLIIAVVLGLTFVIAARAQKPISEPISELALLSRRISQEQDYSLRGIKRNADEIGDLVEAFNLMLGQIAERTDELRKSEKRFRALVNQAVDAFFVHDTEGRIVDVNKRACDSLGYSRHELLSMTVQDIDTVAENLQYRESFWQELSLRGSITIEGRHRRKDGGTFPVEVRMGPLDLGEETLVMAMVRDISERQKEDEARRKLEWQLQQAQKMESIGTLAGGIAHDLNNILCPIFGYIELAMEHTAEDSTVKHCLEEMSDAATRAGELVGQILTFSRQGTEKRIPIDVSHVVAEAMKLLRASIPTTVEIRQDIHSLASGVLADPTQIHQIVMNLCTNAYQAMKEKGGVLSVTVRHVDMEVSDIGKNINLLPGPYVKLEISDTGHGMDKETLERVFEPYFTTKAPGEGTGLGLAVVHGIVKKYGGTITVYSELGKGTTFHVYLPELGRMEPRVEVLADDAPPPRGSEAILLVDDEEAIVRMGTLALSKFGYRVAGFTNPAEALEEVRREPAKFDLVITDMTMPKMTGNELAREIMALRHDMPVIICTGYSEIIDEEKAKEMGLKDYVTKPIVFKELGRKIRRALDGEG